MSLGLGNAKFFEQIGKPCFLAIVHIDVNLIDCLKIFCSEYKLATLLFERHNVIENNLDLGLYGFRQVGKNFLNCFEIFFDSTHYIVSGVISP